jgi:hypothetical protein
MAITAKVKENWKEDKANLEDAISSLKKWMSDYKTERKAEWKLFKDQYKEDLDNIEETLKVMNTLHKK